MVLFFIFKLNVMAIAIKSIPILKDNDAQRFISKANLAVKNNSKTDFTKQVVAAQAILLKSKF